MSRPFFPSAMLAALALTGHVLPRFTDDWPELTDANRISRTGQIVAQSSNPCRCDRGSRPSMKL